jgi:hypothetical protein
LIGVCEQIEVSKAGYGSIRSSESTNLGGAAHTFRQLAVVSLRANENPTMAYGRGD